MDRRAFLYRSGIVVPALALTGLLEPPAASAQAAAVVRVFRPLMAFVREIAVSSLSEIIAERFDDWWTSGQAAAPPQSEDVRPAVGTRGFTGVDTSPVYANNRAGSAFYGISHVDGFNAFVPFYVGGRVAAVAECPTVYALARAMADWPWSGYVSAADMLMPRGAYRWTGYQFVRHFPSLSQASRFDLTWPEPIYYDTLAGAFSIYYMASPATREGLIQLSIVDNFNYPIARVDYPVQWR